MEHRREPDEDDMALPSGDAEIAKEGEKSRKEMDQVPAHGTDPLHEGP